MNLCVFFRETEPIGDIYISISPIPSVYIQIYYRYWLTWLQRPRGPTICCLQAGELESWWWNSVQVLRPENQGAGGVNPSVSKPKDQELQYLRGGKDGRPSSRRERGNLPFLHLFVLSGSQPIGWRCPRWWEWVFSLSQRLNQTLVSSRTPSQTYPEMMFYQLFGHLLGQSSWPIKINHHRTPSIRIDANGWETADCSSCSHGPQSSH